MNRISDNVLAALSSNRRQFIRRTGIGMGALALNHLFASGSIGVLGAAGKFGVASLTQSKARHLSVPIGGAVSDRLV